MARECYRVGTDRFVSKICDHNLDGKTRLTKEPSTPTVVKLQVPTFLMMASTSATRSFNEGVWSSDFLEYLQRSQERQIRSMSLYRKEKIVETRTHSSGADILMEVVLMSRKEAIRVELIVLVERSAVLLNIDCLG